MPIAPYNTEAMFAVTLDSLVVLLDGSRFALLDCTFATAVTTSDAAC